MRGVDHCWYIEYTHAWCRSLLVHPRMYVFDVSTMIYITHVCVRCTNNDLHHACVYSMYQQWSTPRMYVFDVPTMIYITHVCVWCINNDLHHACVCSMYQQWSTPRMCVFDVPTMIYTTHVCVRCTNNDLHHACLCSMYQQWSTLRMCLDHCWYIEHTHAWCRSLLVHRTHTCVV
jgi:hypothetical protein